MQSQNTSRGMVFETNFFRILGEEPLGWSSTSCSAWDSEGVDRRLSRHHGKELRPAIEVQFTLNVGQAKKLKKFLDRERSHDRRLAEIYVEVRGGLSDRQAAEIFDRALVMKMVGLKMPLGVHMVRLKEDETFEWFDPHNQLLHYQAELDRKLNSSDRLVGTVVYVNGRSVTLRSMGREYHAPYSNIVGSQLRRRAEEQGVRLGQSFSFYPSGDSNGGSRELAEAILEAGPRSR